MFKMSWASSSAPWKTFGRAKKKRLRRKLMNVKTWVLYKVNCWKRGIHGFVVMLLLKLWFWQVTQDFFYKNVGKCLTMYNSRKWEQHNTHLVATFSAQVMSERHFCWSFDRVWRWDWREHNCPQKVIAEDDFF